MGTKTVKFHFSLSKLRNQLVFAIKIIGKCHISKSGGRYFPPSDVRAIGQANMEVITLANNMHFVRNRSARVFEAARSTGGNK